MVTDASEAPESGAPRSLLDSRRMFGIGVTELGIILVVALLVFGPKRLPELARTLGRGMGEFRRASNELRQSLALDDLQNDLRRDLGQAGRIHKPTHPPDRPAQAGDDVPAAAPETRESAREPSSEDSERPPDGAETEAEGEETAGPERPHPGELPLGNDHEHRDTGGAEGEDAEEEEAARPRAGAARAGEGPADAERG